MTHKRKKTGWYDEEGQTRRGLPQVTLDAFLAAVEKLEDEFFEKDEDGDLPVRVLIFDRTNVGPVHYEPLFHTLRGDSEKDRAVRIEQNLQTAALNVQQAADDMRRAAHEWRYLRTEQEVVRGRSNVSPKGN